MSVLFSDTALTISETLQINSIVWIHSLPPGEMGPTRQILEDLDMLARTGGLPVIERNVRDRGELVRTMIELAEQATRGLRPILHIDAHGSPKEGCCLRPVAIASGGAMLLSYCVT